MVEPLWAEDDLVATGMRLSPSDEMLRREDFACAGALVALALTPLACGGGSNEGATGTGTFEPNPEIAQAFAELEDAADTLPSPDADARQVIEVALVLLNRDAADGMLEGVTIHARMGEEAGSLCTVGFEAERPEYALVTLVSELGSWAQIPVSPLEGVDHPAVAGGGDFRDAGIDGTLIGGGYPCRIINDQVALVGG